MVEPFKNVEREILEYIYSTILTLEDYYHNFTIEELKKDRKLNGINKNEIIYWIDQLAKANHIKIRTFHDKFDFRISLEGMLFLEKFYMKENQKFTSFTLDVLDFLKKVEDGKIKLYPGEGNHVGSYPIPEFLNIIKCPEEVEQKKLEFVIYEISGLTFQKGESYVYSNSFGFAGKRLVFFRTLFLTAKGRKYLHYHQKLKNLFSTLQDKFAKEIILEEYNEIEHLRKREKWKDAFIKMGSILEFLIIDYIDINKLDKDEYGNLKKVEISIKGIKKNVNLAKAKIGEKILFLMQYEIFGSEYNNDWIFYDSLIKEVRNCIHLQKYIKQRVRISKDMFDKLYPVFERLILLF